MKIYLLSDLHTEINNDFYIPEVYPDLVILAGDIGRGAGALRSAVWYQQELNVPVILVAGNHEFYRGDIGTIYRELRKIASDFPQVHFLENESVVIGGIRFLGCTLWTNFALYGPAMVEPAKHWAAASINDFHLVRNGTRKLTPDDVAKRFDASYYWLDTELAKPFDGKTVVVTHFSPHSAAIHPRYKTDPPDKLTPYFVPACEELIQKYPIAAWMYGHTHNSIDVTLENGTRLISNQCGYPNESIKYTIFDQCKIIEI